jgi:hypothetical protein
VHHVIGDIRQLERRVHRVFFGAKDVTGLGELVEKMLA